MDFDKERLIHKTWYDNPTHLGQHDRPDINISRPSGVDMNSMDIAEFMSGTKRVLRPAYNLAQMPEVNYGICQMQLPDDSYGWTENPYSYNNKITTLYEYNHPCTIGTGGGVQTREIFPSVWLQPMAWAETYFYSAYAFSASATYKLTLMKTDETVLADFTQSLSFSATGDGTSGIWYYTYNINCPALIIDTYASSFLENGWQKVKLDCTAFAWTGWDNAGGTWHGGTRGRFDLIGPNYGQTANKGTDWIKIYSPYRDPRIV